MTVELAALLVVLIVQAALVTILVRFSRRLHQVREQVGNLHRLHLVHHDDLMSRQ